MKKSTMRNLAITGLITPAMLFGATSSFAWRAHDGGAERSHYEQSCSHHKKGAKHAKNPQQFAKKALQRMNRHLDLSESQQEALRQMLQNRHTEMQQHRQQHRDLMMQLNTLDVAAADYRDTLAKLKQQASELAIAKVTQRAEWQVQLSQVLTREQLEKLAQKRASKRGEGSHRPL